MVTYKKQRKVIDRKYNIKLYFNFLSKYKLLFIFTIFIMLISEALLLIDKLLFKIVIDKGTDYYSGIIKNSEFTRILLVIALVFIIVSLSKAIIKWFKFHFINKLEVNLILDLKRKFFNHLIHLSYGFYTSNKMGSLISRFIRGGSAMERMTDTIVFNFGPLILQFLVVVGALLVYDKTSAIVVTITVIIFILYSHIYTTIKQEFDIKYNNAEDFEKANIADIFTNIDSIKYFGKEYDVKKRYSKISQSTSGFALSAWNYTRNLDAGQSIILSIGTFFIIYFPIIKFINNEISLGTVVFIYTIYGNILGPLYNFMAGMRSYYKAMVDFESLFHYNKIENDIKDLPNATDLKIKHGSVEFKNILFKYNTRKIFSNFNLKIPENKKVALVGPSGSGKSTLIKLLYRFYDVEKGGIFIDGHNIKDFKQESLRSELSIVPQECVLFDDTIYNNIAFSNPKASRQDVFNAMKFAQLDKIVNKFSDKENTIVGERGVKLSGGEKQRVSIARALLADKKILVLDEATSSLDSETEHEIQKDLEKLMENRTSIIIAHRLSTIMKADFIVVFDQGSIVQIDTHEELIKKPGMYKRLWSLQKGGYIE